MLSFEINIVAYCKPDLANGLIQTVRNSGAKDFFIRIWDNSPVALTFPEADEVRWNRFNPSLSRVWNWAIAQSETDWVMVTNDDIRFRDGWYERLAKAVDESPGVLWHGPSRCFLFHKKLLDTVGWFDERLTGITYEDLDYVRRMHAAGAPISYGGDSILSALGENLKGTAGREPLRPVLNETFFKSKYNNHNTEDFAGTPNFDTPNWYPLRPL